MIFDRRSTTINDRNDQLQIYPFIPSIRKQNFNRLTYQVIGTNCREPICLSFALSIIG